MKKAFPLFLCLVLLLTGCAARIPASLPVSSDPVSSEPLSDSTPVPSANSTSVPEIENSTADNAKALAESCIDKSVAELYDLIGQPLSSDYAPSCNGGERAEDGNLYYQDFTVYTLKDGDTETVVFVE